VRNLWINFTAISLISLCQSNITYLNRKAEKWPGQPKPTEPIIKCDNLFISLAISGPEENNLLSKLLKPEKQRLRALAILEDDPVGNALRRLIDDEHDKKAENRISDDGIK
jgi:hypothetical protein